MGLAPLAEVPVRMLSTGQRKRAALARVVASGAPLWLLDEPANGLDADGLRPARGGDGRAPRRRRRDPRRQPPAARASTARRRWRSDDRADPARAAPRRGRRRGAAAAGLLPAGGDARSRSRSGRTGRCSRGPAAARLWMAALLAALLPVDRLVEPDRAAGVLDQLALRGHRRGECRARQARRPLAELRPAADARRDPGRGADEAAAARCWSGSSSAC